MEYILITFGVLVVLTYVMYKVQTKKQVKRNAEYLKKIICKLSPFKVLTGSATPQIVVQAEVADAIYDYATDLWITVNTAWSASVDIYTDSVDIEKFKIESETRKNKSKELKEKMLSKIDNKSHRVYTDTTEIYTFIQEWLATSARLTKGHVHYICNNTQSVEIADEVCNLLYDNWSFVADELTELLQLIKKEHRMYIMGFSFPI